MVEQESRSPWASAANDLVLAIFPFKRWHDENFVTDHPAEQLVARDFVIVDLCGARGYVKFMPRFSGGYAGQALAAQHN